MGPAESSRTQMSVPSIDGIEHLNQTGELLKMHEDADGDAMMSDQTAKKKKRRRKNKNKRNKKAGGQDNDALDDEELEMDSGIQSFQDGRTSQHLNHSSSLANTTTIQNLQVIADQDSQDVGEAESTRGRLDSSRGHAQSGMVCLTKLSDQEFENQLQLFQGRLSSIFESPGAKNAQQSSLCVADIS